MELTKTVLVSGCFDLLHSGHVEFFREASKLGKLYVRLGTDENIALLKHHTPMYNQDERLFMVKSIKYVHDAALSRGRGEFDFEADMKELKPDIYVVNDDASRLPARKDLCVRLGIDMVVLPRTPFESLEARSSTSMKKRLRESIQAETHTQREVEAFHEVIPWRLCFAGGWLDLPWCSELLAPNTGCVVTINIKFHPGVCKDRSGLATSSRKHFAKLWNGLPKHLTAKDAAQYLWSAENMDHFGTKEKHYEAGSQDHYGLFFPGINKLVYNGGYFPSQVVNLNDEAKHGEIFAWLERVLHIVEIPFESRPHDYNSQRVNHLLDPKVPLHTKKKMAQDLANASENAWQGICTMDSTRLGKALSDTMRAWEAMLPYTTNPYAQDPSRGKALFDFWSQYDAPHTKGCLFSGAGGGFLMVISDHPIPNSHKVKINHEHVCLPFPSSQSFSDSVV